MTETNRREEVREFVHYTPGNCALLLGPHEVLLRSLEAVRLVGLRPALLCTDLPDLNRLPRGLRALGGIPERISGWMGAFTASMKTTTEPADLAPLSFHDDGHFDWVLDFSDFKPAQVAPPGWYVLTSGDHAGLKKALLEIARYLREGYDKPRYFRLDPGMCAHARQGVIGCSACLDACPASAIAPGKEGVVIEPHLCQGCGTCTLVCPSGAVRHAVPGTAAELDRLAGLLQENRQTAGVWIVKPSQEVDMPSGWLAFPVTEPASLGVEFWLAALAMGAHRVAIAADGLPNATRAALSRQADWAAALLTGMGHPAAVGLANSAAELAGLAAMPKLPSAELPDDSDKRTLLMAAIEALLAPVHAPVEITLPDGPLGTVAVAAEKCTLCTVCVRLCPTGALHLPGSVSQLAFREDKCVQCGLCVHGCPEKAVSLMPRLLTHKAARAAPRVLAEAEMFACRGCGKLFATQAMVARSRAMMADHPMFQGENARLMELCNDCRQRAMVGVPPF
ncbi:MAG: 4Fe-4S dicluster domain-containing protein [Thiobacillaceae bacterium]